MLASTLLSLFLPIIFTVTLPSFPWSKLTSLTYYQSAQAPPCAKTYQAKQGENCYLIATANSLSITQFYDINGGNTPFGGADCPKLLIGQTVCIQAAVATPPKPPTL
jgi:hypothetical protein